MSYLLPKIPNYTTSFNTELDKVVFSSELDGWCIAMTKLEVSTLKAKGGLAAVERSALKRHEKLIDGRLNR